MSPSLQKEVDKKSCVIANFIVISKQHCKSDEIKLPIVRKQIFYTS